ncbi:MAG: type III-B CRISPR module RAMP protein Cmr6 [Rhodoferax sp.]|nr:type III-B CRISPR module RAMP protein Cmr6 [Rhodoferax sp.]
MEARSTAPFATGLGLEHPVENGFAFLSPYGLPYLAGSGVKGVLRSAARELAAMGDEDINQAVIKTLFGHEEDRNARRGALTCWDVFPAPGKDRELLTVEIMTPHFTDYFQNKGTPHDAGKPNPIPFLAVAAGSEFRFVVTCEPALLNEFVSFDRWQLLLTKIMARAFDWLGFGAKTSVGYGAMEEDPVAKTQRENELKAVQEAEHQKTEQQERDRKLSELSPAMRAAQEFLDARADKNQPELSALLGGLKKAVWAGNVRSEIAHHVKQLMIKNKKWKEKSEKKNPAKDNDHQDTLTVMKCL